MGKIIPVGRGLILIRRLKELNTIINKRTQRKKLRDLNVKEIPLEDWEAADKVKRAQTAIEAKNQWRARLGFPKRKPGDHNIIPFRRERT